jgi:Carboxypeptidase regulatory-like domain/TonB-dependent Receptor Plug Domain
MITKVSRKALCFLVVAVIGSALWGQTAGTGALTVMVTDSTAAVIPAAQITLTNLASGEAKTQKTDSSGSHTFALLLPGAYSVNIDAPGFKSTVISSIQVDVAETHVLTQPLEIGSSEQRVVVTSEAPILSSESSTLGNVVDSKAVVGLPLATRNYTQLLALSPGVVADVYNATQLGRGSQPSYVNGIDNVSNNYQEDGISISNYASATPQDPASFYGSIPIPSPDAIQEFKVQTGGFDAGYGRNAGGNVDVVTRTGGNDVHGSLFEFLRNDALNANGFFQNQTGQPRGKLEQNQFGGVIGGPFIKNKLFWFGSYQGTRQINGVAVQGSSTVTLPEQLTNNRTAASIGAAFCPPNNPQGSSGARYAFTYNPSGAINPASDQVACDGSNLNPVALNLLNAKLADGTFVIPTPQTILSPGSPQAVGFASFSSPARFSEDQVLFNLDYTLSPKNTLSGRYFFSYGTQSQDFNNTNGQPPGSGITTLSGNQLFIGKLTSAISSNLVNEARFSSYYIRASINSLDPVRASAVGTQTAASYYDLMPVVNFTGLFTFGGSTVDQAKAPQQYFEWADQVSWNHGRNTVRFGYDQQRVNWSQNVPSFNRGSLSFQTFADFLLGESAAQNGTSLSNIYESTATIQEPNPGTINNNFVNLPSAFIQDDLKATKYLTFNLGLRWEYNGTLYDSNSATNGGTNPVYDLDATVPIPPVTGTYAGYTVAKSYKGALPAGIMRRGVDLLTYSHASFKNFAPRIGLAFQPIPSNSNFIVRAGYGIFFNTLMGNIFEVELNGNPPSTAPLTYIGPVNALANWANPFNPLPSLGFSSFLRTPTSELSQKGLDPNLETPYTQSYDANIQYEFAPSWAFDLGFAGSHTVHTVTGRALDEPVLATATAPVNCGAPAGCITTNTVANAKQRVPVLGLAPGGFASAGNWGYGNYNSIQAAIRKRFSYGLQMQASYTYGRAFTNVVGVNLQGGVAGSVNTNDPNDLSQSYGPADYNRPQRFIVNYVYTFPAFHNGNGFLGRALTDWSVSGLTTAQSGLPVTFTDPRGGGVYGSFSSSRAQFCPGASYSQVMTPGSVRSRLSNFFNASAFCTPPVIGVVNGVGGATGYGNTGRNVLFGPGQFSSDIAILKNTKVGGLRESGVVEFRAELFNAFNHAMFSNPGVAVSTASFGVISSTSAGPRIIQFGLKYRF